MFCRSKVFEDIDRMIHPETIYDHVVYDLDGVVASAGTAYCQENSNLSNRDELRLAAFLPISQKHMQKLQKYTHYQPSTHAEK